jgi:3-phenylpropionate/trans-cinnamate dioxygenase ferredoxin reductase component
MNANVWDVGVHLQRLVRAGVNVDPARLADPSVAVGGLAAQTAGA